MQKHRPVMLVILDGWGWREDPTDNAVRQAHTPTFDKLWRECPHAFLRTSGKDVGLPVKDADIVLEVRRPADGELNGLKKGALVIGIMDPYGQDAALKALERPKGSAA